MKTEICEEKIFFAIALTFAERIGSITARKLISHFGNPQNIFKADKKEFLQKGMLSIQALRSLDKKEIFKQAEKEIDFAKKYNIDILYLDDQRYPFRLKQCTDAPLVIYVKGSASLNPLKSLSVVGTRKATVYGKDITQKIISDMRGEPLQIVSGLAHGIDTAAHKASIDASIETIAVLGTGLNMIYPAQNRNLAKQICEHGALVTEFSSQLTPEKENFPRRNRIIAGMSDGVIVVEAGKRGGALITAELGNSYNRDVFAIPGKIGDTYSEGCNWLIKTNKAALITSAEDVFYQMNWDFAGKGKVAKQSSFVLTEEEEIVVRFLQEHGDTGIDFLCNSTGYTLSNMAALLLGLEMRGIVKSLPGKMYRLG